ncbi:MAG: GTPase ObgE [Clostridiales bacterium]|nr:GTPase ObgE [Clostridiales bacterium]MDO5140575.1 GTPase ObgE [Eubacteriales bacterium]
MSFADTARIIIKSGKGGDGHVSFRRELFVPNGGPDGGDGGRGGDLIFEVDKGMTTLGDFRMKRKYAAESGENGGKKRCHGKNGRDLVIKVPYGTVVKEAKTGQVITDMSGDNLREVILTGGKGGLGNMHFATSVMQAPRFAQPGQQAQELEVILELKVIADVGLVGFPNVGKSTLISMSSNARPQIANYHFTTLQPHLGVVDLEDDSFVMADIPGLIEGAADGAGLGHDFLRHIQRCRVLIHVVDAAGTEGRDPLSDIEKINSELKEFDPALAAVPMIIAANKTDAIYNDGSSPDPVEQIRAVYEPKGIKVMPISAATGEGVRELLYSVAALLKETDRQPLIYEREYDIKAHQNEDLPLNIYRESGKVYVVEGPRIDRMLGYTNLEDEKGFKFFQNYMKENKIIDQLKKLGLTEGDTVRVGGLEFEYYE